MAGKKGVKKMTTVANKSAKVTGWRQMKQIAENSMKKNGITIDEVRNELKKIRASRD
ncbi:hypothetical protein [Paenibacillus jiagnxiensis]|uniref:hypothetical protein n=1 Tax=Paenibacillus jiagnxiensis TaxID=3228926 RepID=UPI0033AB9463